MFYMLRLISGLLLSYLYVVGATEVRKNQEISSPIDGYPQNTTFDYFNGSRRITDQDVENIVKPFEFLKTGKRNVTSTKLKKSESYPTTQKSRTGSGKSVDISPAYHNDVYTLQESSEEKLLARDKEYHHDFRNEPTSQEDITPLTTPKIPFFDERYNETVKSINQNLDLDSLEIDWENATLASNNTSENFIEEQDNHPNTTILEYKQTTDIQLNKTKKPNGRYREVIQQSQTTLSFETKRNNTISYDKETPSENSNELQKQDVKHLLGDENANEVNEDNLDSVARIFKTEIQSSTKKSPDQIITASDNGLISNKIESEIFKLSPTTVSNTETTQKSIRGSVKFSDYRVSTGVATGRKIADPVVQENQIVPVQVTPPIVSNRNEAVEHSTHTSVTEVKTTKIDILENNTKEPTPQQSTTVLIFVQPAGSETTSTENSDEKTTPRGFSLTTTKTSYVSSEMGPNDSTTTFPEMVTTEKIDEFEDGTIASTSISNPDEFETTTEFLETTTGIEERPTSSEPTEITTQILETTTDAVETTTEFVDTTISTSVTDEARFSKEIKYSEGFTTTSRTSEPSETSTTMTAVPINLPPNTEKLGDTTTVLPIEITTPTEVQKTTTTSKETTSEASTQIIIESTPTKKLLENQTSDNVNQELNKVPTTSISFVHIKNIDKNHTTLLPDVLGPNEIYSTPTIQETIMNSSTETTTTEDGSASGQDGPSTGSGAVVAIVISCVGGVCLIALACLLMIMRNRQNRFNYGQRCRPVSLDDYSVDNVSVFNSVRRKAAMRSSKRSYGNPAFDDPVCLSHPLNFPAISKFAANTEDVYAEFSEIPQIIARTSELPEGCEIKNRYANVIPLPESRVFLKQIEGYSNSDYINGNYVSGPKNTRKYYIACQAPMSNTVDDFWRMIWEQQCKVILMLTHLFENGAEKCFDYLPPSEVLDCHRLFGDYQVTLKKREVKEKYIISSIQLKNMVSNSWREVTHFWYMGWPEKGIPAEANSIIAFLIEARSYMKSATIDKKEVLNGKMNGSSSTDVNPVVVHCSPGTGRTGTVITCDIAIREFEQTRQVDIPKIVYRIRRDRANAVQTKEQYAFIYKVLDLYASKLAGGNLESI